jgi:hypothetical protein
LKAMHRPSASMFSPLPEHPHTFGFDAGAKRDLLDAFASAAAAHELDTFHVLWEITPALCAQCCSHPDAGTMTAGCTPSLYIPASQTGVADHDAREAGIDLPVAG